MQVPNQSDLLPDSVFSWHPNLKVKDSGLMIQQVIEGWAHGVFTKPLLSQIEGLKLVLES